MKREWLYQIFQQIHYKATVIKTVYNWYMRLIGEDKKVQRQIQMHARIQNIIEVAVQITEETMVDSINDVGTTKEPSEKNQARSQSLYIHLF